MLITCLLQVRELYFRFRKCSYICNSKATELGAKVVALSDSNGYIYDENGINLNAVKEIKEVKRGRIKEYLGLCTYC